MNSYSHVHILKDRIVTYDVDKVTPIEILINQPVYEKEIIEPTTNIKANNGCNGGLCWISSLLSVILFIYSLIMLGTIRDSDSMIGKLFVHVGVGSTLLFILTTGLGIGISISKFLTFVPELKPLVINGKPTVYYIPEENKDIYNYYCTLSKLLFAARIYTKSRISPSDLFTVSNIELTQCSIDSNDNFRVVFYPERMTFNGYSFDYSEVMFIYAENQLTVVDSYRYDRTRLKILEEKWKFTDDAGNQDLTKAENYLQWKVPLHSINFTFPNGISTSLSSVYTNELKAVYNCLCYLKLHLPPLRVNEYLST